MHRALLYIGYISTIFYCSYLTGAQTSISDNGSYNIVCQKAVDDPLFFAKFKSDDTYRVILEHVNFEQGLDYLKVAQRQTPQIFDHIDQFKENDAIGCPITFSYGELGSISPTTLRYIKVASDLQLLFGNAMRGASIIEIGGGYGGQCLILSKLYPFAKYTIVDIPSALALTKKYLEANHVHNVVYKTHEESIIGEEFDLVISNFAYTECVPQMQSKYDREILAHSKRGYLTCIDFISPKTAFENKLRVMGIPFRTTPEEPRTSPIDGEPNYLVTWDRTTNGLFQRFTE